jgi:hypothetical protein
VPFSRLSNPTDCDVLLTVILFLLSLLLSRKYGAPPQSRNNSDKKKEKRVASSGRDTYRRGFTKAIASKKPFLLYLSLSIMDKNRIDAE